MKKLEKKDFINICVLISFVFSFILILLCLGYVFGSKIDWANQHIVFPEYFRNVFYKNHSIIPYFSLNIGMGQNIYYFSYYGLLSPIVFLSYILPFIPMHIYMLLASIVSLLSSVILFYKWIYNKYNSKIALIATTLFLLNSTFFYHFHRHIMFVIYMPFLILSLIGVDKYFNNKKVLSLIINTFLIIMTSYYFGAYGCIVVFIYTIYLLLNEKKFEFKKLVKIVWFEIISILMASILLIPTIYVLLNGRIEVLTSSISILKLFSPIYNFNYTFYYSYYSWGLTFIYILAIIYGFASKNKGRVFISVIMSLIILFPIFSFVLNGGMYVDGKCYLPFLPLALLQVCDFIYEFVNQKKSIKDYLKYIVPITIFLIICSITKISVLFLIIDSAFTLIILSKSEKVKNKYLLFIPTIIISFLSFLCSSFNENYIDIKTFRNINDDKYYELSKYIKDNDIYRLSVEDNKKYTINKVYNLNNFRTSIYSSLENINYHNQIRNIFQNEVLNRDNFVLAQTSNVIFNIYSGSKYLITSNSPLIGYKKVKTIDNTSLYENNDVLPIIYASDNIMSKREFDSLNYPNQLEALLNYIVVEDDLPNVYVNNVDKIDLNYRISNMKNIEYSKEFNHYLINAEKGAYLKIKIDPIKDKVLIIKFKMNKSKKGFACSSDISINGINNSLSCSDWKYNNKNNTFEYVISSNEAIEDLEIKFSKSEYDISDIETYTIDYDVLKSLNSKVKKINFKVENNKIIFNINTYKDLYIKTTIPYEEKGYKLLIDNEKSNIIKVDDAYVGFKISNGNHNVELMYSTPYFEEGKLLSLIGFILLIITFVISKINFKMIIDVYKKRKELIMYVIMGVLTTIVSLITYYAFTLTIMNPNNALELQITNILSWIVAATFAYFTNRKYVFNKTNKASIKEAGKFYVSRVATLLLDVAFMYIFVTLLHLNDKIIKLIVQFLIVVLNYIMSKFIVFSKNKNQM